MVGSGRTKPPPGAILAGAVPGDGLSLQRAREIADAYRETLVRSGTSKITVDVYWLGIRRLLAFAEPSGAVDRASIGGWMDGLTQRYHPRTAALYGVAVRQMLKWAADNGRCSFALVGAVPPAAYSRGLAAQAGVPRFKTYQLRHTAGVNLVERGRDLDSIRRHLGTRRLETVQRYRDLVPRSEPDDVRADLDVSVPMK